MRPMLLNEIIEYDNHLEIKLRNKGNKNITTLIDKEDLNLVKNYTWYLDDKGYARTRYNNKNFRMHKLICESDIDVDHINRNRLDNRRCNLRPATKQLNAENASIRKDNSSGVAGVNFDRDFNKWMARISVNKKRIYLGCFDNLDDAIKARKLAEKEMR